MSLCIYIMRIYSAGRNPHTAAIMGDVPPASATAGIPFDTPCAAGHTCTQRMALDPRIPTAEGLQFVTEVHPEVHVLLKSVLFRPVYMHATALPGDTRQFRTLRVREKLCTVPN